MCLLSILLCVNINYANCKAINLLVNSLVNYIKLSNYKVGG